MTNRTAPATAKPMTLPIFEDYTEEGGREVLVTWEQVEPTSSYDGEQFEHIEGEVQIIHSVGQTEQELLELFQ